ncbi:MAG: thermonuclease family protein [Pyrinomonadaceae bacterium]
MKIERSIFVAIATLVLATAVHSQSMLAGRVVQVLDGKTVVIDTSGGKLTAEIQYIEVPEPEQRLRETVRGHLERLVLNKDVMFRSAGFAPGKTFGQLYVNSLDVAVQMLRDGAAWHIDPEKSGQRGVDSDAYEYHQTQAKIEKRGVWGVKDMKPAWQFRADKLELERQAQIAADFAEANKGEGDVQPTSARKPARRTSAWSDINPSMKDPGPLMHGYNAASKTGWLSTSWMGFKELGDIPAGQKLACDVTYVYKQESDKARKGKFVFTLVSSADEWRFLKENTVSVVVDEKSVFSGRPNRTTTREDGKSIEKLTYEVSKAAVEKIVYGGDVSVKIGTYTLFPGQGMQLLLYNMLQAAE